MNLIAAVDENWGIGYRGELLQMIPEDMKLFKEKTIGNVIIMGRKTFESFPKGEPLKDRGNIVLTRGGGSIHKNVLTCGSIEELMKLLEEYKDKELFLIGGEDVYNQLIPYCTTAYITKIQREYEADKHMINLDNEKGWKLSFKSEEKVFEDTKFTFNTYVK